MRDLLVNRKAIERQVADALGSWHQPGTFIGTPMDKNEVISAYRNMGNAGQTLDIQVTDPKSKDYGRFVFLPTIDVPGNGSVHLQ